MVTTYTCQNGLRIVSEHIPHFRSVAVGVFVNTGSRDERPEENGITHFIEHLLFKGTEKRSAKDIAREFDRIGGDLNAYTSKEYTCYYAKVLDHHAPLAVEVLADMFFNSVMDPVEIDKERLVVKEEISMTEDMADDDVHEQLWRVMYPDNAIGAPILGTVETLDRFSRQQILDYMERHYTPSNTVISVAGHIEGKLLSQIESLFGSFERKSPENAHVMPTFVPGQSIKHKETEQAHICLGYPGLSLKDDQLFALAVLNNIIGGSMSSRLFQEIREDRGLAYSVYSYHSAYSDHGTLAIYGGTADHQVGEVEELIRTSLQRMREGDISDLEITDSREQLKGNLLLGLESTGSRMSRNGKYELLHGKHQSADDIIHLIDAVEREHVLDLMQLTATAPAVSIIRSQ
ncbi:MULTISPECIES: pitrilysin family protein [unclassified Planococcus (in: firmicutes)]|uniref:M16 family metallopeptidase n=1 Tax=unclassified Planococcus (in: firmicutes) TaxID=2662419 RepID=UPI000C328349|nr:MULTISPECIES: pitrilysin family protein [unclassified Planococcus (in: firmicutes)]AUD14081.1 peptidase M16 [Planococcus sp. MB-3u-03]PKG48092.1 peptidase M16 [Planococcus sp. Urea-trap-24]PKG91940.1 peptidase M16 [Planococcus sp. Urea-3u-39]PKH43156.1 peptidase M16 [Planococcus sp. MB-3u-09]